MTLEEILNRSESDRYGCNYPDVFTDDCGLDIRWSPGRLYATPSWGHTPNNATRRATVKISSFREVQIMNEKLEKIQNVLIEKFNPLAIILFGSYSRGSQTSESDIDIAIIAEKTDKKFVKIIKETLNLLKDRKVLVGIGIGMILTSLVALGFNKTAYMSDLEIEEKARTMGMHYEDECKAFFEGDKE